MKFMLLRLLTSLFAAVVGVAAAPVADSATPQDSPQPALMFARLCATCHGPKGEGREDLRTPSIAHEPWWYVVAQLNHFHDGRRGARPLQDPQGALMAAVAKGLSELDRLALARHVESLPLVPPAKRRIEGADVARGQELFYESCMECHRYNASGEMAFGSPPLIGRQGWYLIEQLRKFKARHRGAEKGDEKGAKMVNMATLFIEDEQAMRNVVGYILTLNPEPAPKAETPFNPSAHPVQPGKVAP